MLTRKTNEPQTTDRYVSELTRKLRRHLPRDKAETIAEETHAHLTDRVEALTDAGHTQVEAETIALSGFGSVAQYARAAVVSAHDDRGAARWRLVGRLAAANLLAYAIWRTVLPETTVNTPLASRLVFGSLLLCMGAVPLSALMSRSPQTRAYLGLHTAAICVLFAAVGILYVPNQDTPLIVPAVPPFRSQAAGIKRQDYTRFLRMGRREQQFHTREIQALEEGIVTLRLGSPAPASLRVGERYVVPREIPAWMQRDHPAYDGGTSAFRNTEVLDLRPVNQYAYYTVANRETAERLWQERGAKWLWEQQRWAAHNDHSIARMQRAEKAPWGFNLGAATFFATLLLWFVPIIPAVDLLMAHLGRAVWIATRNFRNRRRGHTA